MVRERQGGQLDAWLEKVAQSPLLQIRGRAPHFNLYTTLQNSSLYDYT